MGEGARPEPQERLVAAIAAELGARPRGAARRAATRAGARDASAPDPARSPTCWPATASTSQPGQQVLVRSTTLAAPLLLELQRAILERDAWPLLRVELPGADARRSTRTRATRISTTSRRWRLTRGQEGRRVARHPGAGEHARAGRRSTPSASRARRAARASRPRGDAEEALVHDAVADAGRRAGGRACRSRTFGAFVRARAVPRPARPRALAGASCARSRTELIGRLAKARELRIEADGHRPHARASRAARWVNSDGKRNMPSGEVFTGPLETQRQRPHPLRRAVVARGRRRRRRRADVPRRRGRRGARRRAARSTCAARWPPTTARGASASSASARTSASTAPIGAILFDEKIGGTVHLALGRSYPETGGKNESRAALGPHLRPARAAAGSPPTARSSSRTGSSCGS